MSEPGRQGSIEAQFPGKQDGQSEGQHIKEIPQALAPAAQEVTTSAC
jgi:hypothetical protein